MVTINVMNENGEPIKELDKTWWVAIIRRFNFGYLLISLSSLYSDMDETDAVTGHKKQNKYVKSVKITILLVAWLLFTAFLMTNEEKVLEYRQLAVPENTTKQFILYQPPLNARLAINLDGAFLSDHSGNDSNRLYVRLKLISVSPQMQNKTRAGATMDQYVPLNWTQLVRESMPGNIEEISSLWRVQISDAESLDTMAETRRRHVFLFNEATLSKVKSRSAALVVEFVTDLNTSFPMNFAYDPSPIDTRVGIILAACILLGLYVMIIWELVHRTFAAIIASTMCIGTLALMNERPTMPVLMSWIDVETLLLLFGMMILVAILSETGIFDFLAVYAYKVKVDVVLNCKELK